MTLSPHPLKFYHLFLCFRTIDELQPKALLDAIQNILGILGSLLVAAAVNPYFLVPMVVLSILFVLIRNIYLKITRNLNRLEGIGKKLYCAAFGRTHDF